MPLPFTHPTLALVTLLAFIGVGPCALAVPANRAAARTSAPPAELPKRLTLDDFLTVVFASNLDLAAQRYGIPIAQAQLAAARVSPNPVVNPGFTHDLSQEQQAQVLAGGVTQEIEVAGRRRFRVSVAQANLLTAAATLDDYFRTLRGTAATAYINAVAGRLVWDEDHTNPVFSSLAGRVEKVSVELGQTVKKGDDLVVLRSPDFGQVQADYRKALGDFAQFDKTLTRTRILHEHGAAAVKDVESAQADYDRSQAEKQRAELRLQMLGAVGASSTTSTTSSRPSRASSWTATSTSGRKSVPTSSWLVATSWPRPCSPSRTQPPWVQLDMPEGELGKLRTGQPVALRAPAYPNRVFTGRLATVGAFLDPLTRVAHARASVDDAEGLLKAEMYVSVDVKGLAASETDMEVPARAVLFLNGKYYVFVETAPRKHGRREVTVQRDDAGATGTGIVVRGLPAHSRVVTEGSLLINDVLPEGAEETASTVTAAGTPPPLTEEKTSP